MRGWRASTWLTHDEGRDRRCVSHLVKQTIGMPLHAICTLSADYLRRHDPEHDPDIAGTLLGHSYAGSTLTGPWPTGFPPRL